MGVVVQEGRVVAGHRYKLVKAPLRPRPSGPETAGGRQNPPMSTNDLKGLVRHLEAAANDPAIGMSNHSKIKPENMPTSTDNATHVYIKQDNPKGLLQSYTGPYKIVERPSSSTIKVKMGTFKSGIENIQLHHWANAKPTEH